MKIKKLIISAAVILAVLLSLLFVHHIFGTVCIFKGITGIPCPGCGMTRAWSLVLRGKFLRAFELHLLYPLAPLLVGFGAWYTFGIKSKTPAIRKLCEIALIVICVLFVLVWLVRLINGWY